MQDIIQNDQFNQERMAANEMNEDESDKRDFKSPKLSTQIDLNMKELLSDFS